jgi:hypothetical protein
VICRTVWLQRCRRTGTGYTQAVLADA